MAKPPAHVRVDFSDSSSIGRARCPGQRELGMSYRRAWLLLHSVNTGFSEPAAEFSAGGVEGGGARLTDFGRQLIADYRNFETRVDELAQKSFTGVRAARDQSEPAVRRRAINRSLRAKS